MRTAHNPKQNARDKHRDIAQLRLEGDSLLGQSTPQHRPRQRRDTLGAQIKISFLSITTLQHLPTLVIPPPVSTPPHFLLPPPFFPAPPPFINQRHRRLQQTPPPRQWPHSTKTTTSSRPPPQGRGRDMSVNAPPRAASSPAERGRAASCSSVH